MSNYGHNAVLREALANMLAAFDNPIARRKLGGEFSQQAIASARAALDDSPEQQPVAETKADHAAGEIGYCEFLQSVPFGAKLYAAPVAPRMGKKLVEALRVGMASLANRIDDARPSTDGTFTVSLSADELESLRTLKAKLAELEAEPAQPEAEAAAQP